jgi:IS30 family transposase
MVDATHPSDRSVVVDVQIPSRHYSKAARTKFFNAVTSGTPVGEATASIGASRAIGTIWWRQSAGMEMKNGRGGGLVVAPTTDAVWVGRALTAVDRGRIQAGLDAGMSVAAIARSIGRHRSVVGREITRNQGPDGTYYGSVAHVLAYGRTRRPKEFKLIANDGLCRRIEGWMDQGWSPKLISLMLAEEAAGDKTRTVSHETIYQALYVQTRGNLRADLAQQLSLKRRQRVSRTETRRWGGGSPFKEAFKIADRPAEVEDRAVPGHWEGDLIVGAQSGSAIGPLVERSTRFTMLLHLPGRHTADEVAAAMVATMRDLPGHLMRSITWDRGVELARYEQIQLALDTKLYFCDPHSPWQRGTNENTNRLLRHWFAKGTDLSVHTAADLKRVQDTLNKRPRPTLNLKTPAFALTELLNRAA